MTDTSALRIHLVSSGWDGPFQLEQVMVGARDADQARALAEQAFAAAAQPVCRAKMRIADLGPMRAGILAGPVRGGQPLGEGAPVDARCGVEPAVDPPQSPGP